MSDRVKCEDCSKDWGHGYCGTCQGSGYVVKQWYNITIDDLTSRLAAAEAERDRLRGALEDLIDVCKKSANTLATRFISYSSPCYDQPPEPTTKDDYELDLLACALSTTSDRAREALEERTT